MKINDIKNKLNLENIVNFLYEHRVKITTYVLSIFIAIFLVLTIILSVKSYFKYQEITDKMAKSTIVSKKNIIDYIKKNNLRSIYSITNTINFLNKTKLSEKDVAKPILLSILDKNDDDKDTLLSLLFLNITNNKLLKDIKNINTAKYIIKNIDNDSKLLSVLKSEKTVKIIKKNYSDILDSELLRRKISSFPKIMISDKKISSVLSKLYIYELVFIDKYWQNVNKKYKDKVSSYNAPYNEFLWKIFFPSIDIWKDSYSWKINPNLFGSEYLQKAKYIDINLMSYWSDFFQYAYRSKSYHGPKNNIKDISIWKVNQEKNIWSDSIISLPIKVNFTVNASRNNNASFYWIVSKLTSTSNVKNVMLINELTYYLWKNVKDNILSKISLKDTKKNKLPLWTKYMLSLLKKCSKPHTDINCVNLFNLKNRISEEDLAKLIKKNFSGDNFVYTFKKVKFRLSKIKNNKFDKSTFNKYYQNEYYKIDDIDKLVGARLLDCVENENGFCDDLFTKDTKDDVIIRAIEQFGRCDKDSLKVCLSDNTNNKCNVCRFKVANKLWENYFVSYTLLNDISSSRINRYTFTDRIKDIYKNMLWLLEVWSFVFRKNNDTFTYDANVNLKVYYKWLSNKDLNDILSYIWKNKCSSVTKNRAWNVDIAYNFINKKVKNLYKLDLWADEIARLKELKDLIAKLKDDAKKWDNIHKLLINLQAYRIFSERHYCN